MQETSLHIVIVTLARFFSHCLFDFGCRGCICYMVEILLVSLYTYQDELEAYTSVVYCFPEVCFDIIIH